MKMIMRAELQQMAKENEERMRINTIKGIAELAYSRVVNAARGRTSDSVYHFPISDFTACPAFTDVKGRDTFLANNIQAILDILRDRFPDCDIAYKRLAIQNTKDGNTMYTEITSDIPSPSHSVGPYIVVDWS
jgi:hypothetical protein